MMTSLINMKPKTIFLYFHIYPLVIMIISLIGASLFKLMILLILFFVIFILQLYFILIWRLIIGRLSYKMIENRYDCRSKYHLFLVISIFSFALIPLLALSSILMWHNFLLLSIGIIIFLGIYALIANIFQSSFIAKNLSKIYITLHTTENDNFISWTQIAYFPVTAKKVQKVITESLNKKS